MLLGGFCQWTFYYSGLKAFGGFIAKWTKTINITFRSISFSMKKALPTYLKSGYGFIEFLWIMPLSNRLISVSVHFLSIQTGFGLGDQVIKIVSTFFL